VTGLKHLADEQPDRQGNRRHGLEIDQRFQADAADPLEVAHRGDPVHDRRDHHLDQRERLQVLAGIGKEIADQDAERDGDQNLDVEDFVSRFTMDDRTDRFRGHGMLGRELTNGPRH